MSKNCDHCGIYKAKLNPLANLLGPFAVLYHIITIGIPHFCSNECEVKYYNNKGKSVPSFFSKFISFIVRTGIVLGIFVLLTVIYYINQS